VRGRGEEEIDAHDRLVTPGFVDIHTHYDGQVTWEHTLGPSSGHGVTSVVMGNCGVGFAPAHDDQHELLVKLMEGVEDVPNVVMTTGVPWNWETFPDYSRRAGSPIRRHRLRSAGPPLSATRVRDGAARR
jgi:N-acyl-D-aspartate/D-glutamate deacylase